MNPAHRWDALVEPWRAVAGQLGFALLERQIDFVSPTEHRCFDFLRDDRGTFLDLFGVLGGTHGFWSATLNTWIELDDGRQHLWNVGEREPPPMPPDRLGRFVARVLRPVLHHMVAVPVRPALMRAPGDLVAVIEHHRERVLRAGGAAVMFATLEERFEQTRRDEAAKQPR